MAAGSSSSSSNPQVTPISRTRQVAQSQRRVPRPPSLGTLQRSHQSIRSSSTSQSRIRSNNNQSIPTPTQTKTNLSQPPSSLPVASSSSSRNLINGTSNSTQRYPNQHHLINHQSPTPIRKPAPLTPSQRLQLLLDDRSHHLDQPGPQNRILLSIRSGIDSEVNYGLEILLAASYYEPEVVQVSNFQGLVEALFEIIRTYSSPGPFEDQEEGSRRRCALEAALILRNLVVQDYNALPIATNPRTLPSLIDGLQLCKDDSDPEFLSLLLDILEVVASQGINLSQSLPIPGLQNTILGPNTIPNGNEACCEKEVTSEVNANWSSALISWLDQLTDSSDRSIVLGAYRCLSAFGLLPVNQSVMATHLLQRSDSTTTSLKQPWPRSIERALILLALPDVELLMTILDYLYAITSISPLAFAVCFRHQDIIAIFRLLLVHTHHLCQIEQGVIENLPLPSQMWYFRHPPPLKPIEMVKEMDPLPIPTLLGNRSGAQTPTMNDVNRILLTESQLGEMINLKEPQRAHRWMARVFEPCPDSEVQQVTLWLAYKTQFEPYQQRPGGVTMIAPADAIKLTSEVFPSAIPSVKELSNGEKRFVIKGMKVREKIKNPEIYYCRWKNCEDPKSAAPEGPEALYRHILSSHLKDEAETCCWYTCRYSTTPDRLKYHIRTHIAPRTITSIQDPQTEVASVAALPAVFRSYRHERWRTPNGGDSNLGAIGIGYVSFLVLRNFVRSITESVQECARLSAESVKLGDRKKRRHSIDIYDTSMMVQAEAEGSDRLSSKEIFSPIIFPQRKKRRREGGGDEREEDFESESDKDFEEVDHEGWGLIEIEENFNKNRERIKGRLIGLGRGVKLIENEVLSWASKDCNVLQVTMEVLGSIDCIEKVFFEMNTSL